MSTDTIPVWWGVPRTTLLSAVASRTDTLRMTRRLPAGMSITVELVGETTREVDGETYGDLLDPLAVSRHEVTVLVDGHSVPADKAIDDDVERVRVIRLVQGG
jgi:sulfur carrier protein